MKWQIVLEVQVDGDDEDVERLLDDVMSALVDAGIEDPAIGITSESHSPGLVEIEFVVEADDLHEAHRVAQEILAKTPLQLPGGGTLVGESTRNAELVPA